MDRIKDQLPDILQFCADLAAIAAAHLCLGKGDQVQSDRPAPFRIC